MYRETLRLEDYTPGVIFPTESIPEHSETYDNIFLHSLFHSQKYHTDYDKRQLAYICRSDRAVAKRVDSGATLFGVIKNGTGTELHGDEAESAYDLALLRLLMKPVGR